MVNLAPFTHTDAASLVLPNTTMRQSAGDTATPSSSGASTGRAPGFSSR